jgi:hypothetical protein
VTAPNTGSDQLSIGRRCYPAEVSHQIASELSATRASPTRDQVRQRSIRRGRPSRARPPPLPDQRGCPSIRQPCHPGHARRTAFGQ